MSLSKQFLKSKPLCKVTFSVPAEVAPDAQNVSVLGDFNNWQADAAPLKKQKDGSFKGILELETGKNFEFRYLINGQTWANDNAADGYVFNGISEENSLVAL